MFWSRFFFLISSRKERKNPPPQKAADLLFCSFVTPKKKTVVQTFFFFRWFYIKPDALDALYRLSVGQTHSFEYLLRVLCAASSESLLSFCSFTCREFSVMFFFFFLTLFILVHCGTFFLLNYFRKGSFQQDVWCFVKNYGFKDPNPVRDSDSVCLGNAKHLFMLTAFSRLPRPSGCRKFGSIFFASFFFCIFLLAFLPTCILFCFSSVSKIAPFTRERGAFLRFAWKIETSWVNAGILANSVINGLVPFEYFDAFFGNWNFVWPLF